MPATENRDLASGELWYDSLEKSRRRRRLAAHARKEQNRRKTASLAVSAAVVAAPMWPSVAGSGRFEAKADASEGVKPRDSRERVLLSFGDRSPTVASVQQKLRIMADGIFGPQTEVAVRAFQKRTKLPVTGDVDVRTWLTLFPNDAVVASSGTASGGEPGWAALSTQPAETAPAATAPASIAVATDGGPVTERRAAPRRGAKAAKAKATSLLPEPADSPVDAPTDGGVTPPASPPEEPAAPAPLDGRAPSIAPGAPKPVPPAPPRPVAPLAPGGSFNEMIQKMIDEANRIDRARYSYRWGGGHNSRFTGPYDCSGAVSAVLRAAGLIKSPMVSGDFTRFGARGKGLVTIYANSSHVYMSIKGRFFGTSRANPGGGAGWFRGAPRSGFVVVHVPFERMKPRKQALTRARAVQPKRRAKVGAPQQAPRFVPRGDSVTGGTTTVPARAPATSPAPAAPAPVAPVPQPAPVAGQAPAGSTGQAPAVPAQPAPVSVNAPVAPVTAPPASGPVGPQSPSGSAPSGSGIAPSGPGSAPATGPAGPQAPSAPAGAPGPSGTSGQPGSSVPPAGAGSPPPAPGPSSGGPVSQLGNQAVDGVGDAVGKATSELAPKPAAPEAGPEEGSTGSG